MDDTGWVGLPGSRRAVQMPAPSVAGAALAGGLPESLLLIPLLGPLLWGGAAAINASGGVEINVSRGRIRRGRREVGVDDIDTARLVFDPNELRALHFQLGSPILAFRVPIHDGREFTLKKRARELLLDLLPHTSIAMPESPYDPKGKFAKYNFPGYLTKDEAIAVMRKPPGPGDPLPIPG